MFVATASNANSGAPLGATEAGRRQAASDLSIGSGTVGHSPTALPKGKPEFCQRASPSSAKTPKNADVCSILFHLFHCAWNGTNIEVLGRRIWLRGSKMRVFANFRGLRRHGARYWTSDLVNR